MRRWSPHTATPQERQTPSAGWTFFFFKQKTAYEIGLGIPAEPLFRSMFIPSTFSAFHDETGRLNVDGMNIISNDGSNKLNRSRKRSEERRVGKECRCWWRAYCEKKNHAGRCAGGRRTRRPRRSGKRPRRGGRFFFSSRRRHTRSVSAFLLNRSSDLCSSRQHSAPSMMRQAV